MIKYYFINFEYKTFILHYLRQAGLISIYSLNREISQHNGKDYQKLLSNYDFTHEIRIPYDENQINDIDNDNDMKDIDGNEDNRNEKYINNSKDEDE